MVKKKKKKEKKKRVMMRGERGNIMIHAVRRALSSRRCSVWCGVVRLGKVRKG